MATSIMPSKFTPQEYADFLKTSLADATNLYSNASALQGITPSQLASARANMEESQRQYDAALSALSNTNQSASTNSAGASPAPSGALALANPFATVSQSGNQATTSGALSTATGALTAGQPTTSVTTAAPTATPSLDIGAMLSANALGDNALTPDQLFTLLRFNNLTIDQAAPFLGDATTRAGLVSGLKDYKKSYDARYVDTYDPKTVNTYALYQAEEAARDGRHVDFSNQNRATQIEAMRRGYWTPADLRPSGTGSSYGSQNIYLTSGLTNANQGITGNPLVSTLQNALQNPGGMRENVEKAVRAYEDRSGNVTATPAQIAAADAYVKRLTGNPNATYVQTLRNLDTYGGGGFMYDEQRLLGNVKSDLTRGLQANLDIAKWDPKTRGEVLTRKISDLKVTPAFAAAALNISPTELNLLMSGDRTLWDRLARNELIPTRPVR
jgi:hypothetical protein